MNNPPIKNEHNDRPVNKQSHSETATQKQESIEKKPAAGVLARKLVVEILTKIERQKAYANLALDAAFERKKLTERDRAFVTACVQGVMRHRSEVDHEIGKFSKRSLEDLPVTLRNILRMAVYQIVHMPSVPPSAVTNTANVIARQTGHVGHAKFVNGILRTMLRQRETNYDTTGGMATPVPGAQNRSQPVEDAQQLSLRYSMPIWLVERWQKNFGSLECRQVLEFFQLTPPLSLLTNELAISAEKLQEILLNKNVAAKRSDLVKSCILVDRADRNIEAGRVYPSAKNIFASGGLQPRLRPFHGTVEKLPGFAEGLFIVQDEAGALVSLATGARAGDLVIDLCAAPGGKTIHMSQLMENRGKIIAVDKSASRLELLKKSRSRLGLTNIETVVHNGCGFETVERADIVLLDAPCTGTGVMHRKPDLRYQREPQDLAKLVELQRALLSNAAHLVKAGGVLMYATCSIEPEENFDNICWFLKNFPEFTPDDLTPYLPEAILQSLAPLESGAPCKTPREATNLYMLQLLPSRHGVSGFFMAKLRKVL